MDFLKTISEINWNKDVETQRLAIESRIKEAYNSAEDTGILWSRRLPNGVSKYEYYNTILQYFKSLLDLTGTASDKAIFVPAYLRSVLVFCDITASPCSGYISGTYEFGHVIIDGELIPIFISPSIPDVTVLAIGDIAVKGSIAM